MDQTTFIGALGATIILIAFLLNQTKKWEADYLIYDIFNFVGGLLLVIYALILSSYPFAILNFVWTTFSLKDILKDLKITKGERNASKKFIG